MSLQRRPLSPPRRRRGSAVISSFLLRGGLYAYCQKPRIHSLLASGFCHRLFFFKSIFSFPRRNTQIIFPLPLWRRERSSKCSHALSHTHARAREHTRQQQPENKLFDQSQLTLTPSERRSGSVNRAGVRHGCSFSSWPTALPAAAPEGSQPRGRL